MATKREGKEKLEPIDLSDVPPQPLILKNERRYNDNSRKRPVKECSSKYTGVYFDRSRWKAQMKIDGRVRSIGYFDTEEEAAGAYAKAAFKYKPEKQKKVYKVYAGLDLSAISEQPLIPSTGKSSRFKGVKKNKERWEARISFDGKLRTLGTFDTEEEAASIYARASYFLRQQCADIGVAQPCSKQAPDGKASRNEKEQNEFKGEAAKRKLRTEKATRSIAKRPKGKGASQEIAINAEKKNIDVRHISACASTLSRSSSHVDSAERENKVHMGEGAPAAANSATAASPDILTPPTGVIEIEMDKASLPFACIQQQVNATRRDSLCSASTGSVYTV